MNIKSDKSIRFNQNITSREIRLVDQDGNQVGVVNLKDALDQAENVGLDLVEIAPNAEPPVCRIMDYGKHLFEINKKKAAQRKNQQRTQVKEIKFRPTTDKGDYDTKVGKIITFLKNGDKVKVTIRFRGRELMHSELGMALLKKIEVDVNECGLIEQQPKLEGKQIIMIIGPKRQ